MEKALKTNIFYNDTVFCESGEIAIDVDFTLPDYCPDISRIFKCVAKPLISSKGITGKTITIDGVAELIVFYCDSDGNFSSFSYQYPIEKKFEMSEEVLSPTIKANICCDYINCRAVSGRKVDVHGACSIKVKAVKRNTSEIISDFDDNTVELKRGTTQAVIPMGSCEKYIILEEEIKIAETKAPIRNVIRSNVTSFVKETKVLGGKVMLKGECRISILYCAEGSKKPECLKTVVPFSQILEIEGINDTCKCEGYSSVAFCDIKPKSSVLGENNSFAVTIKLELSAEAFCNGEVAVIEDAFSRKFEAEISRKKVTFEKISESIYEIYSFKENMRFEENISSVIDLTAEVLSATAKFQDSKLSVCGNIAVGCVIQNEDGKIVYKEKNIEYKYEKELSENSEYPFCEPWIKIESFTYTILSADSIEIRFEAAVEAVVYEKKELSLVSNLTIDESRLSQNSRRNAMTIYFPNSDESVWDIARIYNASVEEIMRINELESDTKPIGKMLLVPVM